MALYDLLETVSINALLVRGLFALALIILGIVIGKLIDFLLRKLFDKIDLHKHIKIGFIDLTLLVIRWSIYISFINIGLNQLGIPALTYFLSRFLLTIPAFTTGVLLLALGYALAYYLQIIIKSSESQGWDYLSQLVFYFVLFVFTIYSIRIALITVDLYLINAITMIITAVGTAGVVYYFVQRELKKHHLK